MKFIPLIILLFCNQFCLAQPSAKSSLLFEISGNGLSAPSYIFGTFHIMCKDDFKVTPILEQKINNTKQFIGEIKLDDPNLNIKMLEKMNLKGKTCASFMDSISFEKYNRLFTKITGIPATQLNQYKPFFQLSLLTVKAIPCIDFIQPETVLMQIAEKNEQKILGLETIDEQMEAIDAQPLESQMKELQKMVLNFDSTENLMKEMIRVYLKNDASLLFDYVKKTGSDGLNETILLENRNKKWISKIIALIKEKSSFFAVGAAHLGGSTGILELLRLQGYLVKPISYK